MPRKPRSKDPQESNIIDRFLTKENPAVKDALKDIGIDFDISSGRFIRHMRKHH